MSVSAQNVRIKYDGDDATYLFEVTFALKSGSDYSEVKVYKVETDGTVALLSSGYTVGLVGGVVKVTYPSTMPASGTPLATGEQLVIRRVDPLSQNLALANQGTLSLPAIEAGLDYLLFLLQEQQEQINRVPIAPVSVAVAVTPNINGIPVYANNAAAVAGGLLAGQFYRTGADPDPVCVVHV